MNQKAAMDAYKQLGLKSSVEGASPHQLVAMLLKGAVDKLGEARRAWGQVQIRLHDVCRLVRT